MSAVLVADACLYESLPEIESDGSVPKAVPERRGRKSMSRRSGQSGTIVKQGNWFRVRFRLDIPGQYDRKQMNEKICPTTGSEKLTKPQIERRAQEIIASFGANSEQHFNEAVVGTSLTFRDQSKVWLKQATARKRRPIRESSVPTIQSALDKWLLPKLGDLAMSDVDNASVKVLVEAMDAAGLSPKSIANYVQIVKSVVASLRNPKNGEPIYHRKWDADFMDMPEVKGQCQPCLTAAEVTKLIALSQGWERAFYVLLGATGLRISEALALEAKHFRNGFRTIRIEQQVDRFGKIVPYTKTDAGIREVDLHSDIAAFLAGHFGGREGLLFPSQEGTPRLPGNVARRQFEPRLTKVIAAIQKVEPEKITIPKGLRFHSFRRFRITWLRNQRAQDDILNYWTAHKPKTMTELYSKLKEDLQARLDEAERVGYGFDLPTEEPEVAPSVPRNQEEVPEEISV
jgi:integrase